MSATNHTKAAPQSKPLVWPDPFWFYYHMAAFRSPINPTDEEREKYKSHFHVFGWSVPCQTCKRDYLNIIENLVPFRYENNIDLWEWSVDCHNQVNLKLGKPILTYEQARYALLHRKPPTINNNTVSKPKGDPPITSTPFIVTLITGTLGLIIIGILLKLLLLKKKK